MTTSLKKYLLVCLKGIGMGAADVIPGVSGGTIAFMTGIYEELVGSINNINGAAVKLLFKGRFREFWKHINGTFLVSLIAGILISIMSLAKLMTYLLSHLPVPTWAFFFGLIIASSVFILRDIKGWKLKDGVMLVLGVVLGVVVCTLSPTETPDALWFIFLSGSIAICAMILPGISGSFILLILGKYEFMLSTLSKILSGDGVLLDFAVVVIFVLGALVGILAFSRFLHWLLAHYHRSTLLVLAGFIIGSLVKVWPWSDMTVVREAQLLRTGSLAEIDLQIPAAVIFCLVGAALVTVLELLALRKEKEYPSRSARFANRSSAGFAIWLNFCGRFAICRPASAADGARPPAVRTTAQPYTAGRPTPPRLIAEDLKISEPESDVDQRAAVAFAYHGGHVLPGRPAVVERQTEVCTDHVVLRESVLIAHARSAGESDEVVLPVVSSVVLRCGDGEKAVNLEPVAVGHVESHSGIGGEAVLGGVDYVEHRPQRHGHRVVPHPVDVVGVASVGYQAVHVFLERREVRNARV